MIYIQRKGGGYLETVDEFDTWKEARKMLTEYAFADPYAHYYSTGLISTPLFGATGVT